MAKLTTIAFDADDTLWHNERFFQLTQARFLALLAPHADQPRLARHLAECMAQNVAIYGFGIKGFTLSLIETALDVTDNGVPASVVAEIVAAGREMLAHPVEPLPFAREALEALAGRYQLLLITKGDLIDQERKVAQSGLGAFFDAVEIVSGKSRHTYERIFARHGGADRALMVGNSMRSDVLPAIEAGAWGVYVPHELTWAYEHAEAPEDRARYRELPDLGALPALIDAIEQGV